MSRRVCSIISSRLARASASDLGLVRLAGLARAGDDLVGLVARLGEPLAVLGEQLLGLGLRVRSAASIDSSIAFWRLSSASAMRGNANFAEDAQRDAEDEQRPDHQPDVGRDQEAAALLLGRDGDGKVDASAA